MSQSPEQKNRIFLPVVNSGGEPPPAPAPPPADQRLVIDPITRIEGHLRIEVQIEGGQVVDAWSAGMMFRGIELILPGRDPRDAWVFAQRICGVCTTVHAIASVRAVENALGITIPDNARLLRNLIEASQFVQDHVIHFYHLHALDWVDVVSALSADPAATSDLARSISSWPNSSPEYFQAVRDRVQGFIDSGQLGLFDNAYWGHPAYGLPAEANLLAVAHYLEALEWQREIIKMHALLGGKNPHLQTYLVGGMATALDPDHPDALNLERISQLRAWAQQGLAFVSQVYLPDLLLVASHYKDWAGLGEGVGSYLSYGDFPADTGGDPAAYWLPQGIVLNKGLGAPPKPLDQAQIAEYVDHSWYLYGDGGGVGKHPSQGETTWHYNGPQPPFEFLDTADKYSWLKAPRYEGRPLEVGPLARVAVGYAAGHSRTRELTDQVLAHLGVGAGALFSTLGRTAARGIESLMIAEKMLTWLDELEANVRAGNLAAHNGERWDPATWPAQAMGWGTTEAPRGGLGHWVRIQDGTIAHYQCVVPTTWNGSPRDALGQRGPFEEALIGTPVADAARPVEVLRTVHSFDPCMACAVHVLDAEHREVTRIQLV